MITVIEKWGHNENNDKKINSLHDVICELIKENKAKQEDIWNSNLAYPEGLKIQVPNEDIVSIPLWTFDEIGLKKWIDDKEQEAKEREKKFLSEKERIEKEMEDLIVKLGGDRNMVHYDESESDEITRQKAKEMYELCEKARRESKEKEKIVLQIYDLIERNYKNENSYDTFVNNYNRDVDEKNIPKRFDVYNKYYDMCGDVRNIYVKFNKTKQCFECRIAHAKFINGVEKEVKGSGITCKFYLGNENTLFKIDEIKQDNPDYRFYHIEAKFINDNLDKLPLKQDELKALGLNQAQLGLFVFDALVEHFFIVNYLLVYFPKYLKIFKKNYDKRYNTSLQETARDKNGNDYGSSQFIDYDANGVEKERYHLEMMFNLDKFPKSKEDLDNLKLIPRTDAEHHITCYCWLVKGHLRHLHDGRVIEIKPYEKGKGRGTHKYRDRQIIIGR